jgi:hypothetical protein
VTLVTGRFHVLRAWHSRALLEVQKRTPGATILAVVLPDRLELLPAGARAGLVAALRVVDYVLIADDGDVANLIDTLKPAEVVRLEDADSRLVEQLTEHVHRGQNS